ncbi:CPBP family intramembrane glutamic endopeptidase [Leucobacter sp. NPDC077196]|uniref:CPBP family intramembrane glutamic endopeptidase n=1 Tax=Leucobacter sp. NPDC077196 TaxID=3154959 RepID=UPI003422868A
MPRPTALAIAAAVCVCAMAPTWFVLHWIWAGIALGVIGLALAALAGRARQGQAAPPARMNLRFEPHQSRRPPSLLRDLSLIVMGLAVVRLIPLAAHLDNWSMVKFTLALGGAVAVPYVVSRFVYRDRATSFPWRGAGSARGERWGKYHWAWLVAVIVLAWLILPWYFISSGVYANWPVVDTPDLVARLFVGVGAVGIWDELFFICTVFAVLLRHFPVWLANLLQMVVFVSFLWELGYRSWGPLLTIPFALIQGIIYLRTRSLSYVVTVHLLFDAVVFAVLVHAHQPAVFDWFPTAP